VRQSVGRTSDCADVQRFAGAPLHFGHPKVGRGEFPESEMSKVTTCLPRRMRTLDQQIRVTMSRLLKSGEAQA